MAEPGRWIVAGRDPLPIPPDRGWFVVFRPRVKRTGYLLAGWHLTLRWTPPALRLPRLRVRIFHVPTLPESEVPY